MTHLPTSTAGVNLSLAPCQVGASNEPGVLLTMCLGQQPKLSGRLTDEEFLAVVRRWAEIRGYCLTVRKAEAAA